MQNNCGMLRYFFCIQALDYFALKKLDLKLIPMWAIMQKLVFGEHSYNS